jgi:hypothetical protein
MTSGGTTVCNSSKLRSIARSLRLGWFYTFTLPWCLVAACLRVHARCPQGKGVLKQAGHQAPILDACMHTKGSTWRAIELVEPLNYCWCSLLSGLCKLRSKAERGVVNVYPNNLLAGAYVCWWGCTRYTIICFVLCEDLERPPTLLHTICMCFFFFPKSVPLLTVLHWWRVKTLDAVCSWLASPL